MESTEFRGKGDTPHTQWCVVYDRRTGAVVHLHQYIGASSADACSLDELAEQAMEQAAKRHGKEFLRVEHPSEDMVLDFNARYRVDLEAGGLRSEKLWRSKLKRSRS